MSCAAHHLQELAVLEQEIRVAGLAKALVAAREGLVDQHAAGCRRGDDRGQQRTPEIVGDDHRSKAPCAQGARGPDLDIGFDDLDPRIALEVGDAPDVAIDRRDAPAARQQQSGVPPAAAGEVRAAACRAMPQGCTKRAAQAEGGRSPRWRVRYRFLRIPATGLPSRST